MAYYMDKVELTVAQRFMVSDNSYCSSESMATDAITRAIFKGRDKETFVCFHLNIKNKIKSYDVVSVGSLVNSIVHPREVYRTAILAGAANVIFMHNHPSDDPEPSIDDIEITHRLSKAGAILGINVLDHIVITSNPHKYYSFRQSNII